MSRPLGLPPIPDLDQESTRSDLERLDVAVAWGEFFDANTASGQFAWARKWGRLLMAHVRRMEGKDDRSKERIAMLRHDQTTLINELQETNDRVRALEAALKPFADLYNRRPAHSESPYAEAARVLRDDS